jgi:hypothetical protein
MNCAEARTHLPALLYGDLAPDGVRAVQEHLAGCPACREEFAALRQVSHALDAVPAPSVNVDLSRVFQEAAARQARRAKRWRRVSVACGAVAALVLLAFGLRLQVRLEAHQVSLSWGDVPNVTPPPVPHPAADPAFPARVEERLQLASDLIHALSEDLEERDARQQSAVKQLRAQLALLQQQGNARWAETEHDIDALYTAQFGPSKKGE